MKKTLYIIVMFVLLIIVSCRENSMVPPIGGESSEVEETQDPTLPEEEFPFIKEGSGILVEIRNENEPYFTQTEYEKAKEGYFLELSPLDELGRVGSNWGCFDYSHMPKEERTPLSTTPTGWIQKRYEIVSGGWLYNRSHIIGFQISGLNDEGRNLMTGTRAFNAGDNSMLTYENLTADHMRQKEDHHVLYRVTPEFEGDNLLSYGVLMESDCLECDESADYCVFVFNMQNGITIDYRTGDSWLTGEISQGPEEKNPNFVLNKGTKKFHLLTCPYAPDKNSGNYLLSYDEREIVIEAGYSPCNSCTP